MDYLISIVIPAYNYARLLPRAIDSVTSQRLEGMELIIVDDGSADDTPEVLAEYQQRFPWIRSVRQQNAGAAAARNHGIRLAKGRFVLLLDADDELLPGALENFSKACAENPEAGVILGGLVSVYPDGHERIRPASTIPGIPKDRLVKSYLLEKKISISHSRSMFLRELLVQCPYPEHLRSREDIPVFAFLLANASVAIIKVPVARIYKHPDSLRHNSKNEESNAMQVVSEVFDRLPATCQGFRKRYAAQQYLSLFRAAASRSDDRLARYYYGCALKFSILQALQWTYLRKAIRLLGSQK